MIVIEQAPAQLEIAGSYPAAVSTVVIVGAWIVSKLIIVDCPDPAVSQVIVASQRQALQKLRVCSLSVVIVLQDLVGAQAAALVVTDI